MPLTSPERAWGAVQEPRRRRQAIRVCVMTRATVAFISPLYHDRPLCRRMYMCRVAGPEYADNNDKVPMLFHAPSNTQRLRRMWHAPNAAAPPPCGVSGIDPAPRRFICAESPRLFARSHQPRPNFLV